MAKSRFVRRPPLTPLVMKATSARAGESKSRDDRSVARMHQQLGNRSVSQLAQSVIQRLEADEIENAPLSPETASRLSAEELRSSIIEAGRMLSLRPGNTAGYRNIERNLFTLRAEKARRNLRDAGGERNR